MDPTRYGKPWTRAEDALLDKLHDEEVARITTRRINAVRARRLKKILELKTPKRPWTPEEEKLLGTQTDLEIGRLLGRHRSTVADRRRELGIPRSTVAFREWTGAELELLGTAPDREIAVKLKRSVAAVSKQRILLGIPHRFVMRKKWTDQEDALLGTKTDEELAGQLHRSLIAVTARRRILRIKLPPTLVKETGSSHWTAQEDALLGTKTDEELARQLHRSVIAVTGHRRMLRIRLAPALVKKPRHTN